MPNSPILGPVIALVAWTLIMMVWMYVLRFPAMRRAGISMKGRVGSKGGALDGVVEDWVQWKAHNYNHLMEQPTLFYAVVLTLGLLGDQDPFTVQVAWVYVFLRIVHSLVQALWNKIVVRFSIFALASVALIMLAIRAVALAFAA